MLGGTSTTCSGMRKDPSDASSTGQLYPTEVVGGGGSGQYTWVELPDGDAGA